MNKQILIKNKLNKLNKKYHNLLLEERLLNLRLTDILKNFNPNTQNSRSFKRDSKLIKQAENRLLEITIEIEKILSEILEIDTEKMSAMHSPPLKPARTETEEEETLATGSAATSSESIVTALEATKTIITGTIPKVADIFSTPLQSVYTQSIPIVTPRSHYNPNFSYEFPPLNETAEEKKDSFQERKGTAEKILYHARFV